MEGPRKERTAFAYVEEEAIDEELLCPICHSPFLKPVQTVCCRACFCEDCISRTASCPLCRHSFGLGHGQKFQDTSRLVNNMVNRLKVRCSLCSAECERGDFEVHLQKQCPEKHSACSAHDVGCQATMPQKNKQDHESACPFVAIRPCLLRLHNRMNKLEEEKQELDERLLYQGRELQNRIDKLERDKLRLENNMAGANFRACTLLNVIFSGCVGLDLTGATCDSLSQVL